MKEWRGTRQDQRVRSDISQRLIKDAYEAVDGLLEQLQAEAHPRALLHYQGASFTMSPDSRDYARFVARHPETLAGVYDIGATREMMVLDLMDIIHALALRHYPIASQGVKEGVG